MATDFLQGIQTGAQLASVRVANEMKKQQLLESQQRIGEVKKQGDAKAMEAAFNLVERVSNHPVKTRGKLVDNLRPQMEQFIPGVTEDFFLMLKDEEGAAGLQSTIKAFNQLKSLNPEAALEFAAGARANMSKFQASQLDLLTSNLQDAVKFSQKKELEAFKQTEQTKREVTVEGAKESARKLAAIENQQFTKELVGIKDKVKKVEKLGDRTRQIEDRFQSSNSRILSFSNLISSKNVADFTGSDDFSLMFQFISMLDDSVVRGNEIGTFNQGFSLFDRLKGKFRNVVEGGRFDDRVRKQVIETMKLNISGILQNQKNSLTAIQRGAKVAGASVNDIITDPLQQKLLTTKDLKSLFKVKSEGAVAPTGNKDEAAALFDRLSDPNARSAPGVQVRQAPAVRRQRKRLPVGLLREAGLE